MVPVDIALKLMSIITPEIVHLHAALWETLKR